MNRLPSPPRPRPPQADDLNAWVMGPELGEFIAGIRNEEPEYAAEFSAPTMVRHIKEVFEWYLGLEALPTAK